MDKLFFNWLSNNGELNRYEACLDISTDLSELDLQAAARREIQLYKERFNLYEELLMLNKIIKLDDS